MEILSPKTARLDLEPKRKAYARFGVRELWIIDPEKLRISIFEFARDQEKPTQIQGADARFAPAHFPGMTFAAAEIFRRRILEEQLNNRKERKDRKE